MVTKLIKNGANVNANVNANYILAKYLINNDNLKSTFLIVKIEIILCKSIILLITDYQYTIEDVILHHNR